MTTTRIISCQLRRPWRFRIVISALVKFSVLNCVLGHIVNGSDGLAEATAKPNGAAERITRENAPATSFSTNAYQREGLRLLVEEANKVAEELLLPEERPITQTALVQSYVCPFARAQVRRAVGMIATRNYAYYVTKDNKFCYLEKTRQEDERNSWQTQYSWPMSRMDTNAAYELATQWLASVSMDVQGLNQDCQPHILVHMSKGTNNVSHFVPLYSVYWTKGAERQGSIALVKFFMPTKTLVQLRVEDARYILRRALQVTNLRSSSFSAEIKQEF